MSQPLRVLLIEDSAEDAARTLLQLEASGYTPESQRVETAAELRAALAAQAWDVILSDYSLHQLSAPAALQIVREQRGPDTPFILVSGMVGEERAVECIRQGAQDFILKDRPARLPHAIARELADAALRTEQSRIQKQLDRAEQALRCGEKLRSLGQMAAGIAHDLRNILTPLSFRLQLLSQQLKRGSLPEAQESVAELQKIIRTGIELIDRIRRFSQKPAEARSESVDLNLLVQESLALARPRLVGRARSGCHFHTELGSPPVIRGNASELTAALVNLISNSIDAMPGGGNITLRTRDEAGGACIQIADDGPGLSAEAEEHLFEPFFTTKGEAGTGLGLAMVHATVQRHQGTLSLVTGPGKGTQFSLWFPQLQPATAATTGTATATAVAASS
ncbi:MAG: ATP-binding protein [Polyangia bacterium]